MEFLKGGGYDERGDAQSRLADHQERERQADQTSVVNYRLPKTG
jgi:hypothetical protein